MTDQRTKVEPDLAEQVGIKATRKLKARRNNASEFWYGLGLMGLIGWSVVVPTLLGAALGIWLDQRYPGGRSWTLALLAAGLTIGCFTAWHWVKKEELTKHDEREGRNE